ncbi:MAG: hypothetical protein HFI34_07095 [Lachnospiraceae bacterium]|nr:hypothetical protein [Lachnospiraceae bacterium]
MLFLYCTVFLVILVMFIFTHSYKKELRQRLYKGKMYYLSGLSMYVADKVHKRFRIFNNNDIQKKIQKLEPDKDSRKQVYLQFVNKISIVILCIIFFMILGVFNGISIRLKGDKTVTTLQRPEPGNGPYTYNLDVINYEEDQVMENVVLTIDEYKMSEDEINQELDRILEQLLIKSLGKNIDYKNITKSLDFSNRDFNNVTVFFTVNEDGFLNENGTLNEEQIYEYYEKNHTDSIKSSFSVIVSYQNFDKEFYQPIEIKLEDKQNMFSYKIMKEIGRNCSDNEKNIVLPNYIDGKPIKFLEKKEKESVLFALLGICMGVLIFLAEDEKLKKRLKIRKMQLETDYASIVCKLTLLNEAGSTLLMAWERIIADYESEKMKYGYRYAYEEMKIARYRMKSGISEAEAYAEFGRRCDTASYIKLGCLLEQNIKKGTKGLKNILDGEVREAFADRKLLAKKKGEEASTKLLLPMLLMLLVSMVVIIVPAFMSMNL